MTWYADLHLHSKYSRATSRDCDLEHLASWAQKKGITVVATGDITHPVWRAELRDKLLPAEAGLYRLRPELENALADQIPAPCRAPVRFLLSGEISTIYKKGERVRKVHHVVYVPHFEAAERLAARLARIGNLNADGRPILGLDSRHLLEIVLESGAGAFLVPAHIWTPWFSVLGSRGGFDSLEECYDDLTPYIFALETGLSSDPEMNWRISALDRYRLVSNSDAHSPAKLGREATIFAGACDYYAIRHALESGAGYVGTVEFFPEEGKYHLDGHRKCQSCLTPAETAAQRGRCPVCGEAVVIGVMNRVNALADRQQAVPPATAGQVRYFVPLTEIIAELCATGVTSQRVINYEQRLLARFGAELTILGDLSLEELTHAGEPLLAEALRRLRCGAVIRQAGYDGEYGTIRLFQTGELNTLINAGQLFAANAPPTQKITLPDVILPLIAAPTNSTNAPLSIINHYNNNELLAGLDAEQRAAAEIKEGAILIIAGPGSGKTRTLTHRIAHLITAHGVAAEQCLAITFTRRAAAELQTRLAALLPEVGMRVAVHTFHSLGLLILRSQPAAVGLNADFRIINEAARIHLLKTSLNLNTTQAQRLVTRIARLKASGKFFDDNQELAEMLAQHDALLRAQNSVDFDDLVSLAVTVLTNHPEIAAAWRARFTWLAVDEYQDIDSRQHHLLRLLAPPGANLCAIGDPNQAIYAFRGADPTLFQNFASDWQTAQIMHLRRNYRSGRLIVAAASQIIDDAALPLASYEAHRVVIHAAASERAEAAFVVNTIEQLIGGHSFFSLDSGRGGARITELALSDFAILARTDTLFASLTEALERAGLPIQRRSHTPLATPEVIMLLDDYENTPTTTLKELAEQRAITAIEPAQASVFRQAAELVTQLLLQYENDMQRLRAELALLTESDALDPRAERIALLTLHAAKGLEFRVVFIIGCEDGLLPLRWSENTEHDEATFDEERRLFYVGITRARERLFLTHAHQRLWRGKIRDTKPSPFLNNLEEQILEYAKPETKHKKQNNDKSKQQLNLF